MLNSFKFVKQRLKRGSETSNVIYNPLQTNETEYHIGSEFDPETSICIVNKIYFLDF